MKAKHIIPIAAAVAFGLYPATSQLAYQEGANAIFVILVTTFFRAGALVCFCALSGKPLLERGVNWRPFLMGGFLQAASIFGIIGSLVYIPGPVTITLVFTHTTMLLLFMAARGEVRLDRVVVRTTLVALFGVSLVVDVFGNLNNLKWVGIGLAVVAAVVTMGRLYVFGQELKSIDPAVVGARMFSIALLFLLALLLFDGPVPPHSGLGYLAVALSSLSLVLGTFGMFYGIALVGAFQFSLLLKLEPVFTALFSWFVLSEVLNLSQYLGMLLVVASLIVNSYHEAKKREL